MPAMSLEKETGAMIADMLGPIPYWGPPADAARRSHRPARRPIDGVAIRPRSPRSVLRARSRGRWRGRRVTA